MRDVGGKNWVWWGRATYTHIHLAAGARKAQLVKVQGGHREEEGGGLSRAGMGWSRLCWAGLGQWVQCWAYSLQAMGSKPSL